MGALLSRPWSPMRAVRFLCFALLCLEIFDICLLFLVLEAWLTPHTIPGPSGKCSSISFFSTHQYYVSLKHPLRCNQTRATESTKGSGGLVGHYTHTFDSTLVQDIPVTADHLLTLIYVLILFSSDNCSDPGIEPRS